VEIRKCVVLVVLAALAACAAAGCGDERQPLPGTEGGTARTAIAPNRPATPAPPQDDSAPSLLKAEGIGSQAELDRALAKLDDAAARAQFENGFRACFTTDRARRNYASAVPAMESVLQSHPNFAPAFRVLAYAHFNMNFDMEKAVEYYEKAIAADPDYGEAHYALSFMLTQSDLARGRSHFERAMKLGVPDERDLRGQFYP
jgi:tetratricopeptide (TPR) repeat protein